MPDDGELAILERARAGDRAAFDALVRAHGPGVERLVTRYVKSAEEARDVAQEVFLRAYENLRHFRGDSSFKTWLHRVAINTALSYRGARAPASWVELEDDMAFTRSLGTTRLSARDLSRKIHQRLDDLPPKQRLVVELRLFQDLPFEEIAAIVDSTENAAKVNFHYGMKRLRELAPRE